MTIPGTFSRWLKFNAVGAIGIGIQLAVLALLRSGMQINYLAATAIAVEAAVLHNFLWHERFTWADRKTSARLRRLVNFHLSNGAISIVGNVVLMKLFTDLARLQYLVANIFSIAICSLANFLASDRYVFAERL